jgi:hypothetical protein
MILAVASEPCIEIFRKLPKGIAAGESASKYGITTQELRILNDLNDAYVLAALKSWNVTDEDTGELVPIPTEETGVDIDADIHKEIATWAAKQYRRNKEALGEVGPDGVVDEDSPTGASFDSNGDEKEAETGSTPQPSTDTEATDTGADSQQ